MKWWDKRWQFVCWLFDHKWSATIEYIDYHRYAYCRQRSCLRCGKHQRWIHPKDLGKPPPKPPRKPGGIMDIDSDTAD